MPNRSPNLPFLTFTTITTGLPFLMTEPSCKPNPSDVCGTKNNFREGRFVLLTLTASESPRKKSF